MERPLVGIDHVAMRVGDQAQAAAWYESVLGLVVSAREGGRTYLADPIGQRVCLALCDGTVGVDYLAFRARDLAALDDLESLLRRRGADVSALESSRPGVERALRLVLPSGHVLGLVAAQDPVGYRTADSWPAAATPITLSHAQLRALDVAELVDALTPLGFSVSDVVYDEREVEFARFVRLTEQHHHLSLVHGPSSGLHHVAFEVSAHEHLHCADRMARAGVRAEYGIGRHGPGNSIFLYFFDPWGNRLEILSDLARVPIDAPPGRFGGPLDVTVNAWGPPPPTSWQEVWT